MVRGLLCLIFLFSAACAHNLPVSEPPNAVLDDKVRIYTDLNGDFYPDGWKQEPGQRAVRTEHSLRAAYDQLGPDCAGQAGSRCEDPAAALDGFEEDFLTRFEAHAAGYDRVFILMAGFNTNEDRSRELFGQMHDRISPDPRRDLVVEFYWDGHQERFGADAIRIWFWAAGSSQVVGQRALRRVLNHLPDQEVYLVSYSRGASTVLSALSDPPYDREFRADTAALSFLPDNFLTPPPLTKREGAIHAILLAPAIGAIDFQGRGPDLAATGELRAFPGVVRSIRYTVNPRDRVLSKVAPPLADNFNPTELGHACDLGRRLTQGPDALSVLQGYPVHGRFGHGGLDYVADGVFTQMLADSGALRGRAARPVRPGCSNSGEPQPAP